jgi:hypothetical protein
LARPEGRYIAAGGDRCVKHELLFAPVPGVPPDGGGKHRLAVPPIRRLGAGSSCRARGMGGHGGACGVSPKHGGEGGGVVAVVVVAGTRESAADPALAPSAAGAKGGVCGSAAAGTERDAPVAHCHCVASTTAGAESEASAAPLWPPSRRHREGGARGRAVDPSAAAVRQLSVVGTAQG